ncbi:MAG TPA: DNA gyrase inhibitor YacG [Myxococcales bacterium]|nr:DNA gyrase inhibitor YacG [Myxococcales bacterium]
MLRCSNCKRTVPPREENPSFPFCSPRCRALDLSRWFTGSYRVASREPASDEPAGASPPPDEDVERH